MKVLTTTVIPTMKSLVNSAIDEKIGNIDTVLQQLNTGTGL